MSDPRELLQAYLDDELTAPERAAVEAALAADPALRDELAKLRAAGALVRASAMPAMPEELTTMIRDRLTTAARPCWEVLLARPVPHLRLGAVTTLALCLFLAPFTRGPELPALSRDVYVTVNDSMTTSSDGAPPPPAAMPAEAPMDEFVLGTTAAEEPARPFDTTLPRSKATVLEAVGGEVDLADVRGPEPRPAPAPRAVSGEALRQRTGPAAEGREAPGTSRDFYVGGEPPAHAYAETRPLPRLQAGEVDDNERFGKFVAYAEAQAGLAQQGVSVFPVRQRQVIQIVDEQGVGVPDLPLEVREIVTTGPVGAPHHGGRTLLRARTDASGQAVFFPGRHPGYITSDVQLLSDRELTPMWFAGERTVWRAVAQPPWQPAAAGRTVDIAFVVDTTGSMSEEISRLRQTIDQVVKLLDQTAQRPKLRFGLVLYRDEGDAYVTKVHDFTTNAAAFRKLVGQVAADGGGDNPEHVQAALAATVDELHWSDAPALRLAFLIGDAPPHLDYPVQQGNRPYLQSVDQARAKGIKFFTISSSGNDDVGEYVWRQLALLTRGKFIFITKGDALGDVPSRPAQPDDGSTPHHVERQDYTVQALPNLIEQCVRRELAALGSKPPATIEVDLPETQEPPVEPPPVIDEPLVISEKTEKKLPFSASLLIVLANLAGWLWAWRQSRRPSLRRG